MAPGDDHVVLINEDKSAGDISGGTPGPIDTPEQAAAAREQSPVQEQQSPQDNQPTSVQTDGGKISTELPPLPSGQPVTGDPNPSVSSISAQEAQAAQQAAIADMEAKNAEENTAGISEGGPHPVHDGVEQTGPTRIDRRTPWEDAP